MRRASSGAPSSPRCEAPRRSEEHTSELQSRLHLVCRLLLEKKKKQCATPHQPVSAFRPSPRLTRSWSFNSPAIIPPAWFVPAGRQSAYLQEELSALIEVLSF